jgi:hypothetical protein
MRVGDSVRLVIPENVRMDGTVAVITRLTSWGAHLAAPAAATGQFRTAWEEMTLVGTVLKVEYTGETCVACGSLNLHRAGTCKVCEDCGNSEGCG